MQTVLITGANSGLGLETARQLAPQDYKVILACRSIHKAQQTKLLLKKENPEAKLFPVEIDLASLRSIGQAVSQLPMPVHALICNAGLSNEAPTQFTEEGIELTFGVNHLGHFALTNQLLARFPDTLKRILVVSSSLHDPAQAGGPFPPPDFKSITELIHPDDGGLTDWKTEGRRRYVQSKLCNVLFVYELARRLQETGKTDVLVNAFNPGFIPTTGLSRQTKGFSRFLMRHILPRMGFLIKGIRTVEESAADLIQVGLHTDQTAKYFDGPKAVASSDRSYDAELARELWEESEKLCRISV
jgi:NAD(P)-dependent dehydrogenase (short-subunit alcohol dehydrogenase family)